MTQSRLNIEISQDGQVTVLRPTGWITAGRQGVLWEKLSEQMERGHRRIVMDLSAAHFVSSADLGVLLFFQRELEERNGCLALAAASRRTLRVLHLSNLRQAFTVCEDVQGAAQVAATGSRRERKANGRKMNLGRAKRNG